MRLHCTAAAVSLISARHTACLSSRSLPVRLHNHHHRCLCALRSTSAASEEPDGVVYAPAGQKAQGGLVYFVSTPIGNLEDITLRAMNILRTADVVASEDTRHTGRLLQLLGIERKGQLLSHHEHNAQRRVPKLVSLARVRWALLFKQTTHIVLLRFSRRSTNC
eukprot:21498-Heterococcus_DN1.PRE.2